LREHANIQRRKAFEHQDAQDPQQKDQAYSHGRHGQEQADGAFDFAAAVNTRVKVNGRTHDLKPFLASARSSIHLARDNTIKVMMNKAKAKANSDE
jgi:hypothetical protein